MNASDISVVICTHNPRERYITRVLGALRAQTRPSITWELVIVDNRSEVPLQGRVDISWHPRGRIVREDELGLTPARLRGIGESRGGLIVFVDDDNILSADYLDVAAGIWERRPDIGAFGASLKPEFEVPPPEWCKPFVEYIAGTEIDRDYWCNFDFKWSMPSGAGLCAHRSVCERYVEVVTNDPLRKSLDRSGKKLASGGDTDLALTAVDLGLGVGRFKDLVLVHIIPADRLTEDYVVNIYAGIGECYKYLEAIRPHLRGPERNPHVELVRLLWHLLRGSRLERRILRARLRAEKNATALLQSLGRVDATTSGK